jgi:hypothetical protein
MIGFWSWAEYLYAYHQCREYMPKYDHIHINEQQALSAGKWKWIHSGSHNKSLQDLYSWQQAALTCLSLAALIECGMIVYALFIICACTCCPCRRLMTEPLIVASATATILITASVILYALNYADSYKHLLVTPSDCFFVQFRMTTIHPLARHCGWRLVRQVWWWPPPWPPPWPMPCLLCPWSDDNCKDYMCAPVTLIDFEKIILQHAVKNVVILKCCWFLSHREKIYIFVDG